MTFKQSLNVLPGRSLRYLFLAGALGLATGPSVGALQAPSFVAVNIDEPLCYMRTANGRTIDLSRFCGRGNASPVPMFSATDQKFLEQYQVFLRRRLGSSPAVQAALNQAATSPQALIQRAQGVCAVLQADTPAPGTTQPTSSDADLMHSMAVKYYCPQLDN